MALTTLLMAGAEQVSQGVISQLRWAEDSQGRQQRQPLTQAHRRAIQQRVESRMGRSLAGREVSELRRITDAADTASRRARQIDRPTGRMPRPGEIERLPGTGNRGGERLTYTVVVTFIDRRTGDTSSITHQVESDSIIGGERVRALTMEAVASGQIRPRQGTDPRETGRLTVQSIDIVSLYRGTPEI